MPLPIDKVLCLVGLGLMLGISLTITLGWCRLTRRRSFSPPGDEWRVEP